VITFDINNESYSGRFGNQIIEIASTIGIASKFNIPFGFKYWTKYQRYFRQSLPELPNDFIYRLLQIKEYTYQDIQLDPKYNYEISNHFFSDGKEYWQSLQSYKYFDHCLDLVKSYFEPNFYLGDAFNNLVSIHVRRGDYVGHPLYTNLNKNYYEEAMSHFPKKRFVIFSDDLDWVKRSRWFPEDSLYATRVEGIPDVVLDWCYQRSCNGHIIANSSYSLSAAYLSESSKVVAPKNWFSGRMKDECPTDDIYKSNWIIV
jgi:hypothetical protein